MVGRMLVGVVGEREAAVCFLDLVGSCGAVVFGSGGGGRRGSELEDGVEVDVLLVRKECLDGVGVFVHGL